MIKQPFRTGRKKIPAVCWPTQIWAWAWCSFPDHMDAGSLSFLRNSLSNRARTTHCSNANAFSSAQNCSYYQVWEIQQQQKPSKDTINDTPQATSYSQPFPLLSLTEAREAAGAINSEIPTNRLILLPVWISLFSVLEDPPGVIMTFCISCQPICATKDSLTMAQKVKPPNLCGAWYFRGLDLCNFSSNIKIGSLKKIWSLMRQQDNPSSPPYTKSNHSIFFLFTIFTSYACPVNINILYRSIIHSLL